MNQKKHLAAVEAIIRENSQLAYRHERTARRCRERLLHSLNPAQTARFLKMEEAQRLAPGYRANVETYTATAAALRAEQQAEAAK